MFIQPFLSLPRKTGMTPALFDSLDSLIYMVDLSIVENIRTPQVVLIVACL